MRMINQEPEDYMASRVSWFALGLLSGAAVALLTSPTSGRENRQLLRRRAREVADTVVEEGRPFVDAQRQRMNEVVERGRSEVQAFGSRVNDAVEQGKNAYKTAKDKFQTAAADASESVRQASEDVSGPRPTT